MPRNIVIRFIRPQQQILLDQIAAENRALVALAGAIHLDLIDRDLIDRRRETELQTLARDLAMLRIAALETSLLSSGPNVFLEGDTPPAPEALAIDRLAEAYRESAEKISIGGGLAVSIGARSDRPAKVIGDLGLGSREQSFRGVDLSAHGTPINPLEHRCNICGSDPWDPCTEMPSGKMLPDGALHPSRGKGQTGGYTTPPGLEAAARGEYVAGPGEAKR